MTPWIVKSVTDDPDRALEIVADQRTKGYTAWIEDEHGKAVDEELLGKNEAVPSKPSLRERWQGVNGRFWIGYSRSRYFVRDWLVG